MKNRPILLVRIFGMISLLSVFSSSFAQETASPFTIGADFYSSYLWRGTKYGTGPAFQPTIKYTKGVFCAEVWGSFDASGYKETDPYVTINLPSGFSLGITDYYYGGKLSETSDTTGSHALEANLGFTKGGFSFSANYIFNQSSGAVVPTGAGSAGGDKYFQVTYAFKTFNLFVGAGNGWHTKAPDTFAVCNAGLGTSKNIKITDSFSLPVTGQIIINPDKEELMVTVGVTL